MSGSEATSQLAKIAGYTEILAKDPRSTVFVPLSEAYRQMGMLDDALDVARKGVQILPNFSPGYAILGRIHAQRGQNDQAVTAFEKALSMDEDNLTALKGLISLRLKKGQKDLARPLLEKVVILKPDDKKAAELLSTLGVSPSPPAKTSSTQVDARQPKIAASGGRDAEPIATSTIAEIYIRQGYFKRAMKVYRDLLHADPENEDIRRKLVLLKKKVEEESTASLKSGPASEVLSKNLPETSPPSPVSPSPLPAEVPAAMSMSDREIAALTRHLEVICQRRNHV